MAATHRTVAREIIDAGIRAVLTCVDPAQAPANWPDTPTRVLLARDDRFFPADFLRRLARQRLGIDADEMPADHHPMLGHPTELADRLEIYRSQLSSSAR